MSAAPSGADLTTEDLAVVAVDSNAVYLEAELQQLASAGAARVAADLAVADATRELAIASAAFSANRKDPDLQQRFSHAEDVLRFSKDDHQAVAQEYTRAARAVASREALIAEAESKRQQAAIVRRIDEAANEAVRLHNDDAKAIVAAYETLHDRGRAMRTREQSLKLLISEAQKLGVAGIAEPDGTRAAGALLGALLEAGGASVPGDQLAHRARWCWEPSAGYPDSDGLELLASLVALTTQAMRAGRHPASVNGRAELARLAEVWAHQPDRASAQRVLEAVEAPARLEVAARIEENARTLDERRGRTNTRESILRGVPVCEDGSTVALCPGCQGGMHPAEDLVRVVEAGVVVIRHRSCSPAPAATASVPAAPLTVKAAALNVVKAVTAAVVGSPSNGSRPRRTVALPPDHHRRPPPGEWVEGEYIRDDFQGGPKVG